MRALLSAQSVRCVGFAEFADFRHFRLVKISERITKCLVFSMILSKIEAFMGHHWTFLGGDRRVFKVSITLLCFEVLKWLVEGESLRWSTYLAVPLVAVSDPVQDSALTAIVAQ